MEAESAYAPTRAARGNAAPPPEHIERPRNGEDWGDPGLRRAAGAVFAVLVIATVGGLFLAQRIKHTPTSVQGFQLHPLSFSPTVPAHARLEQVSFRTAKSGAVTAAIISSSGETVATLVRGLRWHRYLRLCLQWNGRRGTGRVLAGAPMRPAAGICPPSPALALPAGRLAPAGDYRVRVSVRGSSRPVLSPSSFALVRGTAGSG